MNLRLISAVVAIIAAGLISDAVAQERPRERRAQTRTAALQPTHSDVNYGPHRRNVLDFWQAKSDQPTPLLVSIHGGGFRGGNKSVSGELLRQCLDAQISVAAITYRLSDEAIAPAQFHDAARAIQFLRHKADDWNVDGQRIATTGGSAGAGLSLWLGFHDDLASPESEDPVLRQSTRLSCMIVYNGQTSYDPRRIRELFPGTDTYKHPALAQLYDVDLDNLDSLPAEKYALFEYVSPINHLSKDDPPAMLIYGQPLDAKVTNPGVGIHHARFGAVLKEQMDALGIPCEVVAAGERLGGGPPTSPISFLKQHLKIGDLPAQADMPGRSIVPVRGTITLDGQPLDGASVKFIREDGTTAAGTTTGDGTFQLQTQRDGKRLDGAPPGKYRVVIKSAIDEAGEQTNPAPVKPAKYPAKYGDANASPLTAEIVGRKENVFLFELTTR